MHNQKDINTKRPSRLYSLHNSQVNDFKAITPNNALSWKKLEKYKIVPQAKFVKLKVKHFVEITTIRHDKAIPPPAWLSMIIFPSPKCVPTLALEVQQLPPAWLMTQKSFLPPDPRGEDTMMVLPSDKVIHIRSSIIIINLSIIIKDHH